MIGIIILQAYYLKGIKGKYNKIEDIILYCI